MMRNTTLTAWAFVVLTLIAAEVHAQEKSASKGDKTGTNPINFTHDIRLYNEFVWLNTAGDGNQNLTTLEYRHPFFDGKWQFGTRIRASWIEADVNDDGIDDLDDFGLGEVVSFSHRTLREHAEEKGGGRGTRDLSSHCNG